MSRVASSTAAGQPRGRRLVLDSGGTAARVIDLACPRGHPDHGAIILWHSADPAFGKDSPAWLERLPVPPPGTHYRLECPDCPSVSTAFLGLPDCIAAAAGIRHSETCPWLAAHLAGAA